MIRRVIMLVLLVAITGLLVFGGVHRTQSVLAGEDGRGSATLELRDPGNGGRGGHERGGE